MKVEILPSTVGEPSPRQFCNGAVVNDVVAVDAGTLGLLWPIERQVQIQHVILSHSHLDHIASLPLFLDNVYHEGPECPTVWGSTATLETLRRHVFNDRLWPDFVRLSEEETPFLRLQTLHSEQPVRLGELTVTPVLLDHVIPTFGYVVQDGNCAVAFVSDTGPTQRVWEVLGQTPGLQAVFLEASFPNSHRPLAERSGHLCTDMFAAQTTALEESVRIIACHLKPGHFETIAAELALLNRPHLEVGVPGRVYDFG